MIRRAFPVGQHQLALGFEPVDRGLDHVNADFLRFFEHADGKVLPRKSARDRQAIDMIDRRHLPAPQPAAFEQGDQPAEPRGMARGGKAGEPAADHRHFARVLEGARAHCRSTKSVRSGPSPEGEDKIGQPACRAGRHRPMRFGRIVDLRKRTHAPVRNPPDGPRPWWRLRLQALAGGAARSAGGHAGDAGVSLTFWSEPRPATTPRSIASATTRR